MKKFDLVRYHILSTICAGIAESNGYKEEAGKMRAQGNLRLLVMSEEELYELARMLACPPSRPIDIIYGELIETIEEHKKTAGQWIWEFCGETLEKVSMN